MTKRKNLKRSTSFLLLVCLLMCLLTGCSTKLNGMYTNAEGVIEYSLIFKEDNKVSVSAAAFGLSAESEYLEGEYLIEDSTITITYSLFGLSYDWKKSFEKKGNSIFIDGTEFIKEK